MFGMMVRLIIHGMSNPVSEPKGSSLAFSLAGIYLMYFIADCTVSMQFQTSTLFFIITGLSDAYLRTSNWDGNSGIIKDKIEFDTRKFKFRKVL